MAKSIKDRVLEQSVLMIARELTRDLTKVVVPKIKAAIAKIGSPASGPGTSKVAKYDQDTAEQPEA